MIIARERKWGSQCLRSMPGNCKPCQNSHFYYTYAAATKSSREFIYIIAGIICNSEFGKKRRTFCPLWDKQVPSFERGRDKVEVINWLYRLSRERLNVYNRRLFNLYAVYREAKINRIYYSGITAVCVSERLAFFFTIDAKKLLLI